MALLCLTPGCTCGASSGASAQKVAAAASADSSEASLPLANPVVLDVVRDLDACALGHRGVLLDFGDPSMRANLRPGTLVRIDDDVVEHEGATWLRVRERALSASFYWPMMANDASDASAYVEARVRGVTAHAISVAIDGKSIGTWTLVKGEVRILGTHASNALTLAPGGHELTLHFGGGPRASDGALVEIDWVHVGTGDPIEPYAAPTRSDVVVNPMVGGRSMGALSLRAPGFVRCSGWIPANATLETSLAAAGGGEGEVDALLVRDHRPPVVLGTARVAGSSGGWAPWSVPVTGLDGDGALASVELVVKRASKGTRLLLGEPRVVAARSNSTHAPPIVRGVVLVVLGSTPSKALAPWGGPHAVPELARIAAGGTTFTANRAPSSLANAVVASMLTGLPPNTHSLDDPDSRLPEGPTTVQEACRQAGLATAMFTANPTTSAAFGFARGWNAFVVHDPLEELPATQVFDDASAWIDSHKAERFFVVVHARGGHPPWDAAPEDLKGMPPDGYFGIIEPRRAAEALAKARKHPGRFKEDDRVRAWALFDHAIDAHDVAFGRLLDALRAAGREDDTAIMVTSDVAASEGPPVPFTDAESLDEPLLATPLVIRWPRAGALAGLRIDAPSGPIDLARTTLDALGLQPPAAFQGTDLARLARGALLPAERPMAATRGGRFSIRWGPYVLIGARQRETRMCDLSLDPACIADVRATSPLALESMHTWAIDAFAARSTPAFPRVAFLPDPRTAAALLRWGLVGDGREVEDGR